MAINEATTSVKASTEVIADETPKSSAKPKSSKEIVSGAVSAPSVSEDVMGIVEDLKKAGLDERLKRENLTIVAFVGGRSGFGSSEIVLTELADKVKHKINEGK
mgnify:FL=1